jgi:hypothetical protein
LRSPCGGAGPRWRGIYGFGFIKHSSPPPHCREPRAKDVSDEYFQCYGVSPGDNAGGERAEGAGGKTRRRCRQFAHAAADAFGRAAPGPGNADRSAGLTATAASLFNLASLFCGERGRRVAPGEGRGDGSAQSKVFRAEKSSVRQAQPESPFMVFGAVPGPSPENFAARSFRPLPAKSGARLGMIPSL